MHFKHPEFLFALFLLIIPILIHLFQLRKFRKEAFTNLKFLEKVSIQTRKSSQLKKWLVLLTRLLALAALILAFAQPFFISSTEALQEQETIIYLDNSYSMQATGSRGKLLPRSLQELLENLPQDRNFTLITNNNTYQNINLNTARNELQQIDYTPQQLDFQSLKLRAETEFSDLKNTKKDLIVISDFQSGMGEIDFDDAEFTTYFIQIQPENKQNISIDSAFVDYRDAEENLLKVMISASGSEVNNVPVSVYNGEQLLAKSSVSLSEDEKNAVAEFSIPAATEVEGRIEIDDAYLQFDNTLYFSIQKPEAINAVAINEADDAFLKRIFTAPDFHLSSFSSNEIDYSALSNANFVVLNELESISASIAGNLQNLAENNVTILMIPATNSDVNSYNSLLSNLQMPLFTNKNNNEKLITSISFSHPLYEGVFDENVSNFEYPKVNSSFSTTPGAATVLSYQDNQAFLLQKNKIFVFTAAFENENSNFKNSPLIVPTLFNIGKTALKDAQLYYILGRENSFDVPVNVGQDEILEITGAEASFIPQQQSFANKVTITTTDFPEKPGNFSILKKGEAVSSISLNVSREESVLSYNNLQESENTRIANGIPQVLENLEAANNINELWKWFVIFALFFLLVEMLILKFVK